MKLNKLAVAMGLGMMLASGIAAAAGQGSGKVNFHGTIIDAPCGIDATSADQTVEMGQIANVTLKNGGKSSEVPFTIKLVGCDITDKSKASVTFTGATGTVTDSFAIAGVASGASLLLKDSSSATVKNGVASTDIALVTGNNDLAFSAYLQGNGASATIVPGEFNSVTTFAMEYN